LLSHSLTIHTAEAGGENKGIKIGLKHLRQAEEIFKQNPDRLFYKTEIRDLIGTSYRLVLDVLDYLLHEEKIILIDGKYTWNPKRK